MLLMANYRPFRMHRKGLTKTLLVMRLLSFFLLAGSLHLSANTHAQYVTLSLEHVPLKSVFDKITAQTGFQFIYRNEWLTQAKPVDITVKDATLQQALDISFSGQPFSYEIIDKMVVLKERDRPVAFTSAEVSPPVLIDVHGRVTDINGKPLAGVTILVRAMPQEAGKPAIRVVTVTARHADSTSASVPSLHPAADTAKPMMLAASKGMTPSVLQAIGSTHMAMQPTTSVAKPALSPASPLRDSAGPQPTQLNVAGGAPVVGVAITDANGEFQLRQVPEEAELYISHIGYETLQLKLDKRKELSIRLSLKTDELKDVKVSYSTGYQVLSSERATGSFGKPDMQVYQQRSGSMDVVSRLDGLVPGVSVVQPSSGVTTAGGLATSTNQGSAFIRGTSSVNLSTGPLYVVNGVAVPDFNSINIDDIADITVLKDAAAAAIWGARAANGVIVITTKEGARGQKIRFNYSTFFNQQGRPDLKYYRQLNSRQYIQAARETFDPVDFPWGTLYNQSIAPHEQILYDQYRGLISAGQAADRLDSLASIDNSQQVKNIWFRNAFTTNHTLSASGGNSFYSFYGSLGFTDQQSNRPGQTNNTYRVNLTQTLNANRNITITVDAALADNVTGSNGYSGGGSFDNTFLPYQLFKGPSGNNLSLPYLWGYSDSLRKDYQARSRVNMDYAPLDEVGYLQTKGNNLSVNLTAKTGIRLWKGLAFQGTYGYLTTPGTYSSYDDARAFDQRRQELQFAVAPSASSTPVYYYPTTGGLYSTTTNTGHNWTVRNQLVFDQPMRKGADQLTLQAGQEAQEQFTSTSTTSILGYNKQLNTYPLIDYNKLSQGIPGTVTSSGGLFGSSAYYFGSPYGYSELRTRTSSYFALGSYTLEHKYSLDLSWRQDHSNLFGHNVSTQNRPIWSVGGKWLLSKERFLESAKTINELALRATYGITGNSPYVGAGALYDILSVQPGNQLGALSGDGAFIQQAANNALSWETTKNINIGIDYALLDHRLQGSLDVYSKNTSNLINSVPVNPLNGFSTTTSNLGTLINRGIELSIRSTNIRTRDFSWTTSLIASYNHNRLTSFGKPNSFTSSTSFSLLGSFAAGYARFPMFAYRFAGLDSLGDPRIRLQNKTVTKAVNAAQPGDLRYMGSKQHPLTGGLSNTFSYKGFSLTGNMVYNIGAVMRRYDIDNFFYGRQTTGRPGGGTTSLVNLPAEFADRWKEPGDENKTNIPSFVGNVNTNSLRRNTNYYTYGDLNVVSASYVKLRDVTVSYTVKPRVLSSLKAQALSFYVQAGNFMIWKANHYGIDPEYQTVSYLPYKHNYVFGANLSF
jgi:TonB-linked SusC/RagA family outer membrane protein